MRVDRARLGLLLIAGLGIATLIAAPAGAQQSSTMDQVGMVRTGAGTFSIDVEGADRPVAVVDDIIDEATLERVGGDAELLAEVSQLFIEDAPRQLQAIRDALNRQDAAALHRAAHTLKGSASNFGAARLVEEAYALEQIGRSGILGAHEAHWEGLMRETDRLTLERDAGA